MADAQDRQLPASERKIRKARADGQVARSRDLSHFAALAAAAALFAAAAPALTEGLGAWLGAALRFDAHTVAEPARMLERLGRFGGRGVGVVLLVGAVMLLAALGASMASGGWNFTWKALEPKFSKLNPLSGVARMFSKQQLVDTLKSCLLALILGGTGLFYLHWKLPDMTASMTLPLPGALAHVGTLLLGGMALLCGALALFALVDVPLQRHLLRERLKMSVQEVKKEHKETEGNPEVKARLKSRMRELANRRMLAAVPKADLVVMNPSHFAVALKYEEGAMGAPRVVAKGADLMAFRIRDAAQGAKVPVLRAPPLARALYAHAEIDREIPAALFAAVAQVLAYVYQLRAALQGRAAMPQAMPELKVPAELDPQHGQPEAEAAP
jgi:flagellar biosynthetic protein FlhB